MTAPHVRAQAAFTALWDSSKDGLVFVYHRKPHGRDVLRPFHPDVFLSVVIQVLANEDEVFGWPLVLDVGKDRFRELVPVDVPWVHAMQVMRARPAFPVGALPPVYTFRYLSLQDARGMVVAEPLPVELAEPAHKPRPPRKRKDMQNCLLLPCADEYTPATAASDKTACWLDANDG